MRGPGDDLALRGPGAELAKTGRCADLLRRSPGSGGGMRLWLLLVFVLIRIWVFVLHRLLGAFVFRKER